MNELSFSAWENWAETSLSQQAGALIRGIFQPDESIQQICGFDEDCFDNIENIKHLLQNCDTSWLANAVNSRS